MKQTTLMEEVKKIGKRVIIDFEPAEQRLGKIDDYDYDPDFWKSFPYKKFPFNHKHFENFKDLKLNQDSEDWFIVQYGPKIRIVSSVMTPAYASKAMKLVKPFLKKYAKRGNFTLTKK
jgi:hypothetical protein